MLGNLKKVLSGFLISTTFFNLSVPIAKANPTNQCDNAVLSVIQEIGSFGTSVSIRGSRDANSSNIGNPTNRDFVLTFVVGELMFPGGGYTTAFVSNSSKSNNVATNIMYSIKLQQKWANYLVRNCSNLAVVSYGKAHTDFIIDYAIQSNGTTAARNCVNPDFSSALPWNYQICL